jgi:hypothetical protein
MNRSGQNELHQLKPMLSLDYYAFTSFPSVELLVGFGARPTSGLISLLIFQPDCFAASSFQVAPLCRALMMNGYVVSVSHPKKTRYIDEAKMKSDGVDVRVMRSYLA